MTLPEPFEVIFHVGLDFVSDKLYLLLPETKPDLIYKTFYIPVLNVQGNPFQVRIYMYAIKCSIEYLSCTINIKLGLAYIGRNIYIVAYIHGRYTAANFVTFHPALKPIISN